MVEEAIEDAPTGGLLVRNATQTCGKADLSLASKLPKIAANMFFITGQGYL